MENLPDRENLPGMDRPETGTPENIPAAHESPIPREIPPVWDEAASHAQYPPVSPVPGQPPYPANGQIPPGYGGAPFYAPPPVPPPGSPFQNPGTASPAAGSGFLSQFPYSQGYPYSRGTGYAPPGFAAPFGAASGSWASPLPPDNQPQDPSKLQILVSGRDPLLQEYTNLRRVTAGGGRMLGLLFALLTLLFGWMALAASTSSPGKDILAATLILVGGCVLVLLVDLLLYSSRLGRRCEAEYAERCYNPYSPAPVSVSEFYGDRVVVTTARGSTLVPYSRVTAYVETAELIALFVDGDFVCWRGADLTPYDAALIREHLRRNIHPSVVRIKRPVMACLREPLPIPSLNNDDQLVSRARAAAGVKTEQRRRIKGLVSLLPQLLPMLLVLATATAQYWILSNWFLLDVLAFFAAYLVVGLLAAMLLLLPGARAAKKQDKTSPRDLAFTRDGLAIRRNGFTTFVHKERIRALPSANGVTVEMPCETLFVPWENAEDPEKLKWLFHDL